MAHIRERITKERENGKPVKVYEVVWTETASDEFGLPIPRDPARPNGPKLTTSHQLTYRNRPEAEIKRDELNARKHTRTSGMAEQIKAGELPFGHYVRAWLDSMKLKVARGRLKADTAEEYGRVLANGAIPQFGSMAIASITPAHCEQFLVTLVARGMKPKTVSAHWNLFCRVMEYARKTHRAIDTNPAVRGEFSASGGVGDRERFEHHPLTGEQVAALATVIGQRYPVYELLTYFDAYTGLRAGELTGLEIADVVFVPNPGGPKASVNVRRTKKRKGGIWIAGTLKSKRSRRTVPLPDWLAARMADYLVNVHPHGNAGSPSYDASAPLWPNRTKGGYRNPDVLAVSPLDYSEPPNMQTFYENVMQPALAAVGLPVSSPAIEAKTNDDGSVTPAREAVSGVRLHDLRHTFATMQLSAGKHFMQVSKWLGHSTYTLTLDTYGDWIPEADGGAANSLPEPTAPTVTAQAAILPFRRRSS